MFRLLLLLFLIVPALEIALFIQIGGVIGVIWTLSLTVLTAVLGAALLRWQGLATLVRFQQRLATGQLPAIEMLEGIILLFSGAFLLTPGFFTDTVGFAVLVPAVRREFARWILSHSDLVFRGQMVAPGAAPPGHSEHGRTIEGEYQKKDEP